MAVSPAHARFIKADRALELLYRDDPHNETLIAKRKAQRERADLEIVHEEMAQRDAIEALIDAQMTHEGRWEDQVPRASAAAAVSKKQ